MKTDGYDISIDDLPPFDRRFFESDDIISYIGHGSIGGKASGLAFINNVLLDRISRDEFPEFELTIPRLVVIATGVFDRFMEENDLCEIAFSDEPDDRIALAFQQAKLPPDIVGDLRALISTVRTPLALRSSSLLEDAMYEPFAGVYGTKMIPNNQLEIDTRFRMLREAIKFVYASTFFAEAKEYIRFTGREPGDEKMAVIIQEVVGQRFEDRFYPHISGVARSYNYYPVGRAKPEQGVVNLALGLGKTIVDGGLSWIYSPARPRVTPPVGSNSELLKMTQTKFWAVNMGKPTEHDPINETEYLVSGDLSDAEEDSVLTLLASTYRPRDDRLVTGTGPDGPRVLTFAPILADKELPLNKLLEKLLRVCEEKIGAPIEIEFAVSLDDGDTAPNRFGFLQVRPMVVSDERVTLTDDDIQTEKLLAASDKVMGNGTSDQLTDIVYVKPDSFEPKHTRRITQELEQLNKQLVGDNRRYLLIGFGRWGSSDPWLGIPVVWSQISGAAAIVEATLPEMNVDLSQGSHFFHNISSFQIFYFMVYHSGEYNIDWDWLVGQKEVAQTDFVRHVRVKTPLTIKVDGRHQRGVILK